MDPKVLIGAHGRVIDTVTELFESGYINNIDELKMYQNNFFKVVQFIYFDLLNYIFCRIAS